MRRRDLLAGLPALLAAPSPREFRLVDVTRSSNLAFTHNNGAQGNKWLPETMGPGCAFIDYDRDGWLDILLINGKDLAAPSRGRTTLKLYRNRRNGTFEDVTKAAGLDIELYGLGVAVGDYDNDGWPDIYITALGQNKLFRNNGRGGFTDVTASAGVAAREAFSTSAMWLDYDRDGLLDLFVCNYVRWSPERDVYCTLDGKTKSYCTPEAYRGATCNLFRNNGDGTFKDVTAASGLLDTTSKSLGVALIDYDSDGWPDILVANDTQANKLYRNNRNGTFTEIGLKTGLAFSADGKARAGMGVDVADFEGTGHPGVAITNFQNEMVGLYPGKRDGLYIDSAPGSSVGSASRNTLGFGCFFFDPNLDGVLDLLVANGHIDPGIVKVRPGVAYAQPPHLFLNSGSAGLQDVASMVGKEFAAPKVGRGAAYGDIDNDGDEDVLIMTNGGPAHLYRVDVLNGNKSVQLVLEGTKSNRDAIGARIAFEASGLKGTRTVKSGSSYLSESARPITIGVGRRAQLDRATITWPSGRVEEYKAIKAGARLRITEGKGIGAW